MMHCIMRYASGKHLQIKTTRVVHGISGTHRQFFNRSFAPLQPELAEIGKNVRRSVLRMK